MAVPSTSVNIERLKDENVELDLDDLINDKR